jgi:serine palmitoyltransferase
MGSPASPVVPMLLGMPTKITAFSRECRQLGLAVVVVGYPATSMWEPRARFCMSSAHTRADLDAMLAIIYDVATRMGLCHRRSILG